MVECTTEVSYFVQCWKNRCEETNCSANLLQENKPFLQVEEAKRRKLDPIEINMNVSVNNNLIQVLIMGYPLGKIYCEQNTQVSNSSMNDLITRLCASIKRKKRINRETKEKLINKLDSKKYQLTIGTIEGNRVEINDSSTLQTSIKKLLDCNRIIYMTFEVSSGLEENFSVDIGQTVNVQSMHDGNKEVSNKSSSMQIVATHLPRPWVIPADITHMIKEDVGKMVRTEWCQ